MCNARKSLGLTTDPYSVLKDLYDNDLYDDLLSACDKIIKKYYDYPYNLHIAYSYKALGQLYLEKPFLAKRNSAKATSLYPSCPLSLWIHAFVLETIALESKNQDDISQAIFVSKSIIKRGIRSILSDPCMKRVSEEAALSLIADAYFFLGHLYEILGKKRKALSAFKKYSLMVEAGADTEFEVLDTSRKISALE